MALELAFDGYQGQVAPLVLQETDRVAFELSPREVGREYQIRVGDFPLPSPRLGRKSVEWADDAHFDSARGRTPISLLSRQLDEQDRAWMTRCRFDVWVCPGKLAEAEYRRMFHDLAKLSAGLVFDLLSKSRSGFREFVAKSAKAVSSRSAQMELRLLNHLWSEFSRALMAVMLQPEMRLQARREMVACDGTERLAPLELMKVAARGVDPRRRETPRPFTAERAIVRQSLDTPEHRAIAAFLDMISERARQCLARAKHEIGDINRDRWFRDQKRQDAPSLYEAVDAPRVARLQIAANLADRLASEIRIARRSLPVAAEFRSLQHGGDSPVFKNVRHYQQAWRLMADYLNRSALAVDVGTQERAKQTWRMYEQWVFLQIASAFRQAGLRCGSQRDFVHALSRNRFTVDLQRDTRLVFDSPDGRRLVMRYEPWVFSKQVAVDLDQTVYQGSEGDVPWSPDVLIEFMRPSGQGTFELEYAVIVDAKYVRHLRESHSEQCLKYMKIRSVRTGEAIVRQVWLASPSQTGLMLDDDAIAWTGSGPTASRQEFIMGSFGLRPADETSSNDEATISHATALNFANGILAYLGFDLDALRPTPN